MTSPGSTACVVPSNNTSVKASGKRKARAWFTGIKPDLGHVEVEEEAVLEQAARILKQRLLRLGQLDHPAKAAEFLRARIGHLERECFLVLLLDTRHRILAEEIVFFGTVDSAEIHPREVAKLALRHNAAAVVCAHNHPSGDPEPSAADRAVTARLKSALALIDIRLLDHIVVGPLQHASMAERGWV